MICCCFTKYSSEENAFPKQAYEAIKISYIRNLLNDILVKQ
jgi:hypothetical protein